MYSFDAQAARALGHPGAAAAHGRARHRLQGSEHAPELAGGHLRQPGERSRARRCAHERRRAFAFNGTASGRSKVRDGARSCARWCRAGHAGDHDVAVLRGVRRRRSARACRRSTACSYGAFIVPGPDHAVAVHGEHLERLVRHLLPQVHGHDLRDAVGARSRSSRSIWPTSARRRPSRSSSGCIILATAAFFVPVRDPAPACGWSPSCC